MKSFSHIKPLRNELNRLKAAQRSIGLVPTMGALHAGHLELVKKALHENEAVVVTIFINPIQFNNPDDLKNYPRDPERDLQLLNPLLRPHDLVFMPDVREMYPEPDTRTFNLGPVATVMEGAYRPGHFNGVAIVVDKLFNITTPDRAYFGEKDFQQIMVIRRLIELQHHPVSLIACPIVREPDGLAMSSRNIRIPGEIRPFAAIIHQALLSARSAANQLSPGQLVRQIREMIDQAPGITTEYVEIADELTLQPVAQWDQNTPVRCFIAAYAGQIRLIDNMRMRPPE
ncbi:MAG: pantoate--beta-alanine ligase [Bacteroidales bacterium]|nr:pantoate--beta-alanine ligase [Bacteroidales bacterium]